MEWKILISTFVTIFLAELGDKTQLAAIFLTSQTNKPLTVFVGTVTAMAVVTILGVTLGMALTKVIPLHAIKDAAAGVFILLGVLILLGKF